MLSVKRQLGMGSIGWLVTLALCGFFLLCLFRLGPAYYDNYAMQGALKDLASKNPQLGTMSKSSIRSHLAKYTTINGIRGDHAKEIEIVRKKDRLLVNNIYEKRIPLFLNIDVVLSFANQLDSSDPDACCEYRIKVEAENN